MLDLVYGWMKNIAFYLVIMTAVLEVLPGETYKKYIRFFTGLVMILLVLTPVLKLTGTVDMFHAEYMEQEQKFQEEIDEQRRRFESAERLEFIAQESQGQDAGSGQEESNQMEIKRIEVEEVRIGEMEESDMELDTFRE